jgi:hypothetical protein
MKRWSEGETIKLVEIYRDYECLWDTTKACYKNNQMRQAPFEKIIAEMSMEDFTLVDARQEIKSLRNTYGQELKKNREKFKIGNGY